MANDVSQINFDYNGKHYCLEYTRESVKIMEAGGFNPGDIAEKPAIRSEQLWAGAFLAHHRNVSNTVVMKLYDQMTRKSELLEALRSMLADTYESLLSENEEDSGNVEWVASM